MNSLVRCQSKRRNSFSDSLMLVTSSSSLLLLGHCSLPTARLRVYLLCHMTYRELIQSPKIVYASLDVHVTVHGDKFLKIKLTRCTNFSNLFLEWNSTCFGQFLCPSSGVFHCKHSNGICHTGLLTACEQDQGSTSSCSLLIPFIPRINLRN